MKTLVQVELTRHNVTPAQFLAYVRSVLKRKNARDFSSDLNLDYFASGNDLNFDIRNDNNPEKACKAEKSVSKPYQMQTYILNWDGSVYNEICEFDFWDEKTGTGYYYLLCTETETTEKQEEKETMKMYELTPHDGRKSFYGKARVLVEDNGTETLYSYETPIIRKAPGGELTRLYAGWSQTTGRHIAAFCGLNKAGFMAFPHDLTTYEKAAAYAGTLYR